MQKKGKNTQFKNGQNRQQRYTHLYRSYHIRTQSPFREPIAYVASHSGPVDAKMKHVVVRQQHRALFGAKMMPLEHSVFVSY